MIKIVKIPKSLNSAYETSLEKEKIEHARLLGGLTILLLISSIFVDYWAIPSAITELMILRGIVFIPTIFCIVITYHSLFIKYYNLVFLVGFLSLIFFVEYAIYSSKVTELAYYTYFSSLTLIIMSMYSWTQLKLSVLAVITTLMIAGYIFAILAHDNQGQHEAIALLVPTLFIIGGSVSLGMFGKIARDNNLREKFLLQHELKLSYAQKEKEAELYEYDANHDALTGLPNRRFIKTFFDSQFDGKTQKNINMVFIFLDLNGFKSINDKYGHDAGDKVLKVTAQRLKFCISKKDMLVRLGGDEFLICLMLEENNQHIIDGIQNRIRESISKPIMFEADKLRITTSIGISTSFKEGGQVNDLIALADKRMYEDKVKIKRFT